MNFFSKYEIYRVGMGTLCVYDLLKFLVLILYYSGLETKTKTWVQFTRHIKLSLGILKKINHRGFLICKINSDN